MAEIKNVKIKSKKIPMSETPINQGVYIENENFIVKQKDKKTMINFANFTLKGRHNLLNAMAASTVASIFEISKDSIRDSLTHFKGAPNRMEKVLTIQRVEYINDSKATNVNATFFALDSIHTPIVWIVGGVDKGNDYALIEQMVVEKVKAIICLGECNQKIIKFFNGKVDTIVQASSMNEAVKQSFSLADKGDTVLLSPSCASFDLFLNYEDRGFQFKQAVRSL